MRHNVNTQKLSLEINLHAGRWTRWFTLASTAVLGFALLTFSGGSRAADPLVIGQSLPLGGADDGSSARTTAGAQAYIDLVNASGGIRGRSIQLVTLDDGGDPKRHAANMRQLVTQHKAVALLNCLGDAACLAAAEVAREQKVALIGPLSGAAALSRSSNPFIFRVRAPYAREADALARQMLALGTASTAIITDKPVLSESVQALRQALTQQKIGFRVLVVDPAKPASFTPLEAEVTTARYQSVFLDIRAESLEQMTQLLQGGERWPLVLTTFASGNVNSLMSGFGSRMVGFTAVVPNPEVSAKPIAREIQQQSERSTGAAAVTFAGMEAYINARVCVEALRRADAGKATVDTRSVLAAMTAMGPLDLGGFTLNFSHGSASASDWVDIVVRSRTGHLLK